MPPDEAGALPAARSARRPAPGELTFEAPRRSMPPTHLADLAPGERTAAVEALGHKGFRAKQLAVHYFERLVDSPDEMTDLPAAQRDGLVAGILPTLLTTVKHLVADEGRTVKSVWRLHDGALVESVLMRYPDRVTMCISSQAGCGMNCPFCATGQGGLTRNLSTAEIVEQVVAGARMLRRGEVPGGDPEAERDRPLRVSNVVFMGMGEALANYTRAIGAIRRLTDPTPDGLGMSARGLTMSTVGLVPGIDRLAGEGIPVTLALSLHAPDDELRDELVPINTRWRVDEALDAAYRYFRRPDDGSRSNTPSSGTSTTSPGAPTCWGRSSPPAAVAGCTSTRSRSTPRQAPAGPPRARACSAVRRAVAGTRHTDDGP